MLKGETDVFQGEMAEWSIAAVLKTVEVRASGGSNPSLSAERSGQKQTITVQKPTSQQLVGFFVVRRAWQLTWWGESTMGVNSRQPLATGKGVHREVESEGSLRQSPAPRNTNCIRHNRWDKTATQVEVQRLYGHRSVNAAGRWDEGYLPYHGRSHEHAETRYEAWSKASCEKSAEAIVDTGTSL